MTAPVLQALLLADQVYQDLGTGKYVTIWRRQTSGAWRAAFDMGNEDKP